MTKNRSRLGKVMTVLGLKEPGELGIINPHEHLIIDFLAVDAEKQKSHAVAIDKSEGTGHDFEAPLSLANYYEARRNPFLFRDTLQLNNVDDARDALAEYRGSGGGCIVDVTPIGVGRDPAALRQLSQASGVNVVMGTGFYINDFHPPEFAQMSEDAVADRIVDEIDNGVGGVFPGIIGEIGLVWPVHPQERKSLRAAAKAQARTGLCLTIHPGRNKGAPMEAIRIVEEAGGDPTRTIIDHLDRTLFELEDFVELARTGCYVEQDLFGWETSYYPIADIDMPNDATRVNTIRGLAEKGYLGQVLMSLDIDTRSRLSRYGGEGYHHIIRNVVPIMARKGFSADDIDMVIRANPQRALTIV